MKRLILLPLLLPFLNGMAPPLSSVKGRLASELGQHEMAVQSLASPKDAWSRLWLAHSDYLLGKNREAILLWKDLLSDKKVGAAAGIELAHHKASLQALSSLLDEYQDQQEREATKADWEALARKLEQYSFAEGNSQNAKRAKLVYADVLARQGRDNASLLKELAALEGEMGDWAKVRLSFQGDRNALDALVAKKSPLAPSAMLAWAKKNQDQALLEGLAARKELPEAEEALFLLAVARKDPQGYRNYRKFFPGGRHSSEVLRNLADLPLEPEERLTIGLALYKIGEYGKAVRLLGGLDSSKARYYYGRALWQGKDLGGAVPIIRALLDDPEFRQKALITLGQILEDQKQSGAEDCYRQASLLAEPSLANDALSLLARFYRRADQTGKALNVEAELIRRFPKSQEAADAAWRKFWQPYGEGKKPDAAAIASLESLTARFPNEPQGARAAYWLGKLDEKNQLPEAAGHYRKAAAWDPRGFYGFRARQALNPKKADPFDTGGFLEPSPVRPAWSAGLPPEEASLFTGKGVSLSPEGGELFFLRQHREVECLAKGKALKGWLKSLQGDFHGAIENGSSPYLSYPLGYRPFLLEACRNKNLNPLLLAALVREESRYDPTAVSWVGAMGLAQLMPSTAKGIDAKIGELGKRPLTDPRSNLCRGAWYLAFSRSCFPHLDHLAVAGYNAGTGAVRGWTTRFAPFMDDPDAFIEAIPYRETRDYVRRVFASYWNYRELYGIEQNGANP